ncbi:MAG: acyl-CoA dehydrogenase family protein [Actinomycetota bacterium]|nr:acyl-CoA dehydrogenase family protein [Actinomycetota bacterium]
MDFEFDESQKVFRDSLKEFLDKEIAPMVDEQEKKGPMNKEEALEVMRKFKKIGVGFDVESMSDMASDALAVGIMTEETFRVWPAAAGLVGLSFPAALVNIASDDMRDRLLPKLMANELIGCYAITEPEAGSDNRAMRTTAVLDGDFYVVNGTKTWITSSPVADLCMLVANDEKGERIFLLAEKEQSPYEVSDLHKLGWRAAPTGEIFFEDCLVPKENNVMNMVASAMSGDRLKELMGDNYDPSKVADSKFAKMMGSMAPENMIFAFLRSGMALAAAGISQAALDAAIQFARERTQFGRPIGRMQLIQEKLYNMKALTVTSRLLAYWAYTMAMNADPEARMASSLAKGYACEVAVQVASDAIQIHGGIGLSDEYPLERYFRDARMLTIPDGTTEIQKLVVGRELLGKGFSAYV